MEFLWMTVLIVTYPSEYCKSDTFRVSVLSAVHLLSLNCVLQAIMSRSGWEDETRRTVLEGHAILERTAESLARSQNTAAETERVGQEVVSELSAQRETLLRSRQRLEDTDQELSQTHVLLRKMKLHVFTNKIILIVIILLEICILAAVCYIRFFRK